MPKEETDPKSGTGDGGKTFTQADVDRIVQDRVAKEKAKYSDYDELKAKAGKVDEQEAANKSELDKMREQLETVTKAQVESDRKALRAEVAMAKGLTAAQAKRLAGDTREELEADADEILEAFPVATNDSSTKSKTVPTNRPKPDLKGGNEPDEGPVELDPAKLAEAVPRGY